jgi:RNA polymerase sigma factor (sigma-70 family)
VGQHADVADLEALYRARYRHFLRVALLVTHDEESAHEAVQEGFASAIRSKRSYRGEGQLEAWVWRMIVNAAKKHRREPSVSVVGEDSAAQNGDAVDRRVVRAWIACLPERQRLAVYLRYYADLDYRAIASVLDVEVGTVSATLSAAHRKLRRNLEEVQQ